MKFKEYSAISDSFRKLCKKPQRKKIVKVIRYPFVCLIVRLFIYTEGDLRRRIKEKKNEL